MTGYDPYPLPTRRRQFEEAFEVLGVAIPAGQNPSLRARERSGKIGAPERGARGLRNVIEHQQRCGVALVRPRPFIRCAAAFSRTPREESSQEVGSSQCR